MSTESTTRPRPLRSPTPDTILGLVLTAIAAFFLVYTFELSAQAAAWPRAVLALLAVLGVAIAVRGIRSGSAPAAGDGAAPARDDDGAAPSEQGEWERGVLRRPALTLGVVVVYVGLLEVIGFLPATALYLLGHLWFGGVRDWRVFAGVVVGLIAFIHLLFAYELNVPLPTGLLFE
ncbi:hypothetical protein HDA32_005964 [Spinactinospora alkalitolerans]|uniref:DUF1468 domain-containing protein n=1 Tax=Spinactinospora alkalitolerans TaxID=687207 RepID=A0A852U9Q7_9ACTN|nr:tripartite tricarboxylate transporter TctB family protein [Spinactinospora alkalitolerans]NYE50844.1 hypothetical protein [Spinactinospora alkalitolerans]